MILTVIYLGPKIPEYVLRNLEYLYSTFKEYEIYFIGDSKKTISRAAKLGVKTWLAPNPKETWTESHDLLNHPMGFRDGFWFKTLARFLVINSFMQLHPDKACLQIEADVFLFPDFPFHEFQTINNEIAFPMQSAQSGIASLLFIKNHQASQKLANLVLSAVKENREITDMLLLGQIANSNSMFFEPLSTLPRSMSYALYNQADADLICRNTFSLPGVFDGITVGQYLLGIDPRNSRGVRVLHQPQISHSINIRALNFELDFQGKLIMKGVEERVSVYNLHNHAKDLRLYSTESRTKLLKKRIDSGRNGEKKELVLQVLVTSAYLSLMRRIKSVYRSK